MSVKKYMDLSTRQIAHMSDKELKKATTILNSAANKRIKRAYAAGAQSEVMENILDDGKFSVKGLESREEIEAAYMRVRGFMDKETSSLTGIRKSQDESFKALAKEVNKELPPEERINDDWKKSASDKKIKRIFDLVWSQVDKLAENKTYNIGKSERYQIAAFAFQMTTRKREPIKTKRDLFSTLTDFYNENYKKSVESGEDLGELTEGERDIVAKYSRKGFT